MDYVSLCETCRHGKEVVSGKGSRFLLCSLSVTNKRFPKYPPQPIVRCSGFEQGDAERKNE
jgi:hypothetical protein